jgi:hypothetical protein
MNNGEIGEGLVEEWGVACFSHSYALMRGQVASFVFISLYSFTHILNINCSLELASIYVYGFIIFTTVT